MNLVFQALGNYFLFFFLDCSFSCITQLDGMKNSPTKLVYPNFEYWFDCKGAYWVLDTFFLAGRCNGNFTYCDTFEIKIICWFKDVFSWFWIFPILLFFERFYILYFGFGVLELISLLILIFQMINNYEHLLSFKFSPFSLFHNSF